MKRALKVCSCVGCPEHPGSCPTLVGGGRCAPCAQVAERARGSRRARGYDAAHDRLRAQWASAVERGDVDCARCGQPIRRGQRWALDHTDDRSGYLGPSHQGCNVRAARRPRS